MLAALFLQASLLVKPLVLGDKPPETRAIASVRFGAADGQSGRTRSEQWIDKATARPGEFLALARQCAEKPSEMAKGLVGTYWKSMLAADTGDFLFSAAVGDVKQIHEGAHGGPSIDEVVAMRLERDAAVRQIFVSGTDAVARSKADGIVRELKAGADFAALAREKSDDKASALRGGDFAIYERGPSDELLRKAAFETNVGEIAGPIASPLGFHILQRVPVESVDPRLRDDLWAHGRAILVAFGGAKGADPTLVREHEEAEKIANDLAARIRRGEDMALVAKSFNDDRGGRERGGDLGWIRRGVTSTPPFLDRLFLEPPGTLIGPLASQAGFVMFRREDPGPRSRIDLRKSALIALHRWALGGASDHLLSASEQRAFKTAAKLDPLTDSPGTWLDLESRVWRCSNASELVDRCADLPDSVRLPSGADVAVRALVSDYASALVEVEPEFTTKTWPALERAIDAEVGRLRGPLAMLGDSAIDEMLRDLGIRDPRTVVALYVDMGSSRIELARDGHGAIGVVSLGPIPEASRLQVVLFAAATAIDLATQGQHTILAELREALDAWAGENQAALQAVMSAESADVMSRAFDPTYLPQGSVFGATDFVHGWFDGYWASSSSANPNTGEVRGVWENYLSGKLTRAQVVDAIVPAAKTAK